MHMRNTGILPAAILCLAASLACGGKTRYTVPDVVSYSPAQGPVGTTVVISGAYFSGITAISFGGQPAVAYQVNNQSLITAIVPETAATGPVTVANQAGVGTDFNAFIVTPQIAALDILGYPSYPGGLSQTSGVAGTVITVTGYGLNDVAGVTIGGNAVTFTPVNANMITVSTLGAATGPVVVTVPGAGSTTLTATGPTFTVQ